MNGLAEASGKSIKYFANASWLMQEHLLLDFGRKGEYPGYRKRVFKSSKVKDLFEEIESRIMNNSS